MLSTKGRKILLSALAGIVCLSLGLPAMSSDASSSTKALHHINYQIKHMSTAEKIGQCTMADLSNSNSNADYYVKKYHLGGVMLDGSNFINSPNRYQFKRHLKLMQKTSHHSLIISTDQEGGLVDRLSLNPRVFRGYYLSPRQAYRHGGLKFVHNQYRSESHSLRNLGINMNLAPVVGMPAYGNNLYARGLFRNVNKQVRYAHSAVNGIQGNNFKNGVAASAKHFPGFTHEYNTDFYNGYTAEHLSGMRHYNFKPFKSAIKASTGSIMTSFIDPVHITGHTPTAFSNYMINTVLKHQLGYKGVVLTDDLNAVASRNYGRRKGASPEYLALKAGNTMIMTEHPTRVGRLISDAKRGDFSKKLINSDVRRNLYLKYKLGLHY